MIGWLVLIGYPVLWLFTARKIYFGFRSDEYADNDDMFDNVMDGILAMLGALFWPLALPLMLVMAKPKMTAKEMEEELQQRKNYIASLERELGIK